ncbi:hypothetical protein OHA44_36965 [Streptomyces sp. NBC_00144]|uniref:hypothetical protein n=1 Tax=Streptomyces sp. NBC_00144 TaxID=2975665 RepID=UPI003253EAD2
MLRRLVGAVEGQAAQPPTVPGSRGPTVSRASFQADLAAADARTARLSEALGKQVWRELGIGGPDDTEQQVVDLDLKLQDRNNDLAANRELIAQLNRGRDALPHPD